MAALGLAVRFVRARTTLDPFPDLRGAEPPVCPGGGGGEEEVCDEVGSWEVCMCVCHVWARVRVCENAGVFIYGMCV